MQMQSAAHDRIRASATPATTCTVPRWGETPADQCGLTDIGTLTFSIDIKESVLLHGVTTGLEARW